MEEGEEQEWNERKLLDYDYKASFCNTCLSLDRHNQNKVLLAED